MAYVFLFFRLDAGLDETWNETDKFQIQERELFDEVNVKTSVLEHLEQELELMKEAAEMVFNNQHSVEFYIDQLNEQVQAKRDCLLTMQSEWLVKLFMRFLHR